MSALHPLQQAQQPHSSPKHVPRTQIKPHPSPCTLSIHLALDHDRLLRARDRMREPKCERDHPARLVHLEREARSPWFNSSVSSRGAGGDGTEFGTYISVILDVSAHDYHSRGDTALVNFTCIASTVLGTQTYARVSKPREAHDRLEDDAFSFFVLSLFFGHIICCFSLGLRVGVCTILSSLFACVFPSFFPSLFIDPSERCLLIT